ncbi:MAG: Fic family protein [Thermoleophilia bacterium]
MPEEPPGIRLDRSDAPPEPAENSGRYTEVVETWDPDPRLLGSRRSRTGFRFTAYVPDEIGEWEPRIGASLAALIAEAERLCAALNHDPPTLGSMDALARQLLRAEAVASSRIEGLIMSHRRLALAQAAAGVDSLADQIVGNIAAMEEAVTTAGTLERITTADILEIHRTLLKDTRDAHIAGVVRERQNWIGGEASSPASADFVPPPAREVCRLLDDLCRFLNRTDLTPATQAAIAHAQFETIHPFADGNGRVGRALIQLVLRRRGLAPEFVPPISLAFAADAQRYVKGLTVYRYGDLEDWLEVFADALGRAAERSRSFAADVVELQHDWIQKAGRPRRGSSAQRLIEMLPGRPVLGTDTAAQMLEVSHEAARQAMNSLEAAGVVRNRAAGKGRRIWEAIGLFDLLDRFERELGDGERTPRPSH